MKMKKNAVALSVATLVTGLGFAGAASAGVIQAGNTNAVDLRVSPGGIGHSLLQPYFTSQNGNVTLVSIVNTDTVNGKAIKVRFRGASNSDDLFDFQLFLSPTDVWTASISAGSDGRSVLQTTDRSCTLPESVRSTAAGTPFVLDRLPAFLDATNRARETREGYVEYFNMADIRPGTALFTAIKHVNGVPTCNSSTLGFLATNPTTEAQANGLGLFAPSSGLFGNYAFVNQTRASTSWSAEMTSILASRSATNSPPVAGLGNIVFFPQTSDFLPNPSTVTADPLLSQGLLTALMFDAPDMSTPYLAGTFGGSTGPVVQANQLSEAIATRSIRNEYVTTASIDARTDWTLSFPTRRYFTAMQYGSSAASSIQRFSLAGTSTVNPLPFFTSANTSVANSMATGIPQICVGTRGNFSSSAGDLRVFDREETPQGGTGFVISPGTATTFRFCGEVSVLSFNAIRNTNIPTATPQATGVLRAELARQDVMVPFNEGWAQLVTTGNTSAITGRTLGLPILGRYFLQATNPANAGFSTNFGGSWEHRYSRPVPSGTTATPPVGTPGAGGGEEEE